MCVCVCVLTNWEKKKIKQIHWNKKFAIWNQKSVQRKKNHLIMIYWPWADVNRWNDFHIKILFMIETCTTENMRISSGNWCENEYWLLEYSSTPVLYNSINFFHIQSLHTKNTTAIMLTTEIWQNFFFLYSKKKIQKSLFQYYNSESMWNHNQIK